MNLALSALLILLLLLPGFSFRLGVTVYSNIRKYAPGKKDQLLEHLIKRNISKVLSKLNFTETIFLFSLVPVLLHLISVMLLNSNGIVIKFHLLLNIFAGKQDVLDAANNKVFQSDLKYFLGYTAVETVVGYLLGMVMSWLLLWRKWVMAALADNNIWYQLFTGMTLPKSKRQRIVSILVEVLTFDKEATIIYSGDITNFEVLPDSNNLSFLTLSSVIRQNFIDGKQQGAITPVPGNILTVFSKDIINVNIIYMELIADPTDPAKRKLSPIL
jgi:hypothetical protein